MGEHDESVKSEYERLKVEREPYEAIAELCAQYTIPSLFIRDTNNYATSATKKTLQWPSQSIGAVGINNIATNLLLAVLPSGASFYRLLMGQKELNEVEADPDSKSKKAALEQSLRKVEAMGLEILETAEVRAVLFEILRQYLLAQVLIYQDPKTDRMRGFTLQQHVNVRDQMGQVLVYITEENINPTTLDAKILVEANIDLDDFKDAQGKPKQSVGLYTKIERVSKNKWLSFQELNGERLKSTEVKYNSDTLPWFDIGFTRIPNEPYARGYLEQLLPDLAAVNGLQQALIDGSFISSRTIFLLDPASTMSPESLVNVPNGGFIKGRKDDITPVQTDKAGDYATTQRTLVDIKRDLQMAFMSHLAARRDAERVTAEEFSSIAEEIDSILGGTFSRLAVELQGPMARLNMISLRRRGLIKNLKEAGVKPTIVTGIAALGRGTDLNRLRSLLGDLKAASEIVGPEAIAQELTAAELVLRLMNGNGINAQGLVRSAEEIKDEQAALQKQQQEAEQSQQMMQLTEGAMKNPEGAEYVTNKLGEMSGAMQEGMADMSLEQLAQLENPQA